MNRIRITSVILALILILSAIASVSCGDAESVITTKEPGTDAPAVQSGDNTDPVSTVPEFSSRTYDGETFTSYIRNVTASNYAAKYILVEEDSGDIINSNAEIRNMRVEEKFNIKLAFMQASNPANSLQNDINNGDTPYNLIIDQRQIEGPAAQKGLLADFNDIGVDVTTSWWDKNAAHSYSAYNNLFIMPCDISTSNLGSVRFFCFNNEVLENFHLTSPYEYVEKNEWTLENFYQLVRSVSSPIEDGVGVYGLVNEVSSVRNHLLKAVGIPWLEKIDEEHFECSIGTTYAEKTQKYLDSFNELSNDTTCVMSFTNAHNADSVNSSKFKDMYAHCRGLFADGHFLFVHTNMNCVKSEFGEMKKGFGVVMNPKYNTDQAEYYHGMDSNALCLAIPAFSDNELQMVGDILDYWAWESSRTVMEAFYEITLKSKRADDPVTAGMLDVIKGSVNYYFSELISMDISTFVTKAAETSVSSAWDIYKKTLPKQIESSIKKFNIK